MYTKTELAWKRLSGLYGYPFVSQYGTEPTAEWELALGNLDVDQIRRGIERCTTEPEFCKFPPNPMQFLALCLPSGEDLGLPSETEALAQAVGASTGKHPAVVYTLRQMGNQVFELRRADSTRAIRMFAPWWAKTVEHVSAGGELPEKSIEIENQPQKLPKEAKIARLKQMREEIGV